MKKYFSIVLFAACFISIWYAGRWFEASALKDAKKQMELSRLAILEQYTGMLVADLIIHDSLSILGSNTGLISFTREASSSVSSKHGSTVELLPQKLFLRIVLRSYGELNLKHFESAILKATAKCAEKLPNIHLETTKIEVVIDKDVTVTVGCIWERNREAYVRGLPQ